MSFTVQIINRYVSVYKYRAKLNLLNWKANNVGLKIGYSTNNYSLIIKYHKDVVNDYSEIPIMRHNSKVFGKIDFNEYDNIFKLY